ncbi:hypothetical protein AJ80_02746 [Polytolypa hystricis UAMH7299]|uniref:PUM-HD domain-containing protein n=1 Tax=Polytolypa hystricis (strain UAMH7299) TaxID=1447883 RepID=A0A2B7YQF5_POLH7|nr:hypothetical protein AJ80_02746 [Polytolypa hystricis UAMH7299]
MSFMASGSPGGSRKPSSQFLPQFDGGATAQNASHGRVSSGMKHLNASESPPNPLVSSKLGNLQSMPNCDEGNPSNKKQKLEHSSVASLNKDALPTTMDQILAKLSPKEPLPSLETSLLNEGVQLKLSEQQRTLVGNAMRASSMGEDGVPCLGSRPAAPNVSPNTTSDDSSITPGYAEMLRLKQELHVANSRIALQEQELAQTRVIKHTMEQAMGPPSEADFGGREITEQTISNLQSAFNASTRPFNPRGDSWAVQEDAHSDISDALSAGAYNRARGIWTNPSQSSYLGIQGNAEKQYRDPPGPNLTIDTGRNWNGRVPHQTFSPTGGLPSPQRILSGPSSPPYSFETRFDQPSYFQNQGGRRSVTQVNRGGSCFPPQNSPWGTFSPVAPGGTRAAPGQQLDSYQQPGMYQGVSQYQPRPIGTPLSPTAAEFTSMGVGPNSWSSSAPSTAVQTYVSPMEPLNYRRLLDKSVSCDWKYIVDKIVCNNDQQASIFLQQKLKVGTPEQKYDIIEAIVNQAYPLMVNRFGNFLVQRCFEHGTPDQVVAIANAIRGNTLSLSMDPFGCHVVQKAFDCVPEEHKAVMVHELLRRIPETVIHRYACHVWQKLFELRWSGEPPQIMAKVNEALRGMWHEVALGETGSLVVQNIFENCVEDEKRQAIEEVLAKIDLLSHGQFGNWCIQHICEHGAPHDKSRAIEHIILWAADYSMDQFASKVVEKCLKIGGTEFLDRYLARVCTGRPDRPRMPLIDIAGDQYGNYLIQWILMNAQSHQREIVASHIRKHMVSLRGSKFGSRVAMLCCNPNHVTRPGPGAGVQINRFSSPTDDRFPSGQSGGRFSRGNQWSSNYPPFR